MFRNSNLLLSVIPDVLIVIGMIVALVLGIARRKRIGAAASTLAAVGLAILILGELLGVFWSLFGFRLIYQEFGGDSILTIIPAFGIVTKVLWVVGLGLVIGAVFVRRPALQPSSPF